VRQSPLASQGWCRIRLKHLATLDAGGTPSVDESAFWADGDEGTPWVTIADMTREPRLKSTERRLTAAGLRAARLPVGSAGTLLFAMYASLGTMAVLETRAAWNQAILGVTPRVGVDPGFLRYSLEHARGGLKHLARSNTQDNLNQSQVANLQLVAPDGVLQHRIADFLDRECERIGMLVQAVEGMRGQARAVARALFDEHTAGRPRIRVRHVITAIEQGWSPQCDDREPDPQEWGVLKLGCVNAGKFTYQAKALAAGLKPRPNHTVVEGDVLVSRANTRNLVGSCAIVTSDVRPRTIYSDLLYRLIPDERKCIPEFLAAALGAPSARSQIEALAVGSAGSMPKLAQGAIKQLAIPNIEPQQQRETLQSLEVELRPFAELRHEAEQLRAALVEYRNALITEAVTGKLDVTRLSDQQLDESALASMEGGRPEVLST